MRLGVLTGGGDCAGLNAAIRAVVRTVDERLGLPVTGYRRGWAGVRDGASVTLTADDVSAILPHGGTILGTSRSLPGMLDGGVAALVERLRLDGLDGLVAIGGDGTLRTTLAIHEAGFPVIAVPKTIDNDVLGTDVSIGFDTALAVATEAVERLQTTASSHDRVMVVEVMGRHAGHLAASAAIASGASAVVVPEEPFSVATLVELVTRAAAAGRSSTVVVAEGAVPVEALDGLDPAYDQWGNRAVGGVGAAVGAAIEATTGIETRTTVLGHVQRGGPPTASDRLVASRLGLRATTALLEGISGRLVAIDGDQLTMRPLEDVAGHTRVLSRSELDLIPVLARAA